MQQTIIQIKEKFDLIENLPTLSVITTRLLELLKKPSVSMNEISKLMEHDLSITAKVLRVANSPYYGFRQRIDTLKMALVVLGVNETSNIILGFSMFDSFNKSEANAHFDINKFWEHSAITAYISQYFGKKLGIRFHGEEFTAGLMHDIGKLITAQYFPSEINNIFNFFNNNDVELYEAEERTFGITHMQMGFWLANKWKLPQQLSDVIFFHHHSEKAKTNKILVAVVSLSDSFAKLFDSNQENKENVLKLIYKSSAWNILEPYLIKFEVVEFIKELETNVDSVKEFLATLTDS